MRLPISETHFGAFITVPPPLSAQYTLVASTTRHTALFCPEARVVDVPPPIGTFMTVPAVRRPHERDGDGRGDDHEQAHGERHSQRPVRVVAADGYRGLRAKAVRERA
jgi:hypothetical protein